MKCSFCGAVGVKIDLISYNSRMVMRCVTCKELDGVTADNEKKGVGK
jgi:phage FluMu protein Com